MSGNRKKNGNKYLPWLIIGFFLALLLRVILLPYGNHNDLITNTGWSEWIYLHGPKGFYENKVWVYDWPTQLPLVNLIYDFNYVIFGKSLAAIGLVKNFFVSTGILPSLGQRWFDFEKLFGWTYYGKTPYMTGHVLSMKIIPIIADLAIGFVIYLLGSKIVNRKKAVITAFVYLFVPYTFYLSALWGQYDQLSALAVLLSFCFIWRYGEKKRFYYIPISVICYFVAVEVKPTAAFTLPFYIYYIFRQKPEIWDLVLSALAGMGLFLITTLPFSIGNPVSYMFNTIYPKVMFSGRNVLSTQAFNFWEFASPPKVSSLEFNFIGIKGIVWGYIFLVALNILAILKIKKENNLRNALLGLFITTGGSYIFATGMLDRYYFTGLLIFLILTLFYKKTIWLWLGAAFLFSVNLFASWGYPVNLQLHDAFWGNYFIIRILSLSQTIIFVTMVIVGLRNSDEDNQKRNS